MDTETIKARFAGKFRVVDSGCWIWSASRDKSGYGDFYIRSKRFSAHRASYALYVGDIPHGMCVCHRCDVRECVNPSHLFLGTNIDNIADRDRKGRQARGLRSGKHTHPESIARGERHGMVRLTADDVVSMRKDRVDGMKMAELAAKYGVSDSQAQRIVSRLNWKHI